MKSTSIVFHEHGKPDEVLRLEEHEIGDPGPDEVLLEVLASPINPSDLGTIGGSYGPLPPLPAVAGLEGVAKVLETGAGVTAIQPGDHVRTPQGTGAWQTHLAASSGSLFKVPADIPPEQAATAFVNPPTAWLLLQEVKQMKPGDWIIQNAANSAVGVAVIQIARHLGLRTLNLVRREELIQPLMDLGANHVLLDNDDYPPLARDITGNEGIGLALNSIGGPSAIRLCRVLANGGTLVTFGGMTGEPVRFPTRNLIFNDICLTGFWATRWMQKVPVETLQGMFMTIFGLFQSGILETRIEATYPLEQFAEALAHNAEPRFGKVLFKI